MRLPDRLRRLLHRLAGREPNIEDERLFELFRNRVELKKELTALDDERHRLLANYLQALGVSPQVAAEDACRIEHVISDESFEKIKSHVSKHLKK